MSQHLTLGDLIGPLIKITKDNKCGRKRSVKRTFTRFKAAD